VKSDHQLGLQPRWFTGKQWADGTAQKVCREEYEDALFRLDPNALSPRDQMRAQMRKNGFKT